VNRRMIALLLTGCLGDINFPSLRPTLESRSAILFAADPRCDARSDREATVCDRDAITRTGSIAASTEERVKARKRKRSTVLPYFRGLNRFQAFPPARTSILSRVSARANRLLADSHWNIGTYVTVWLFRRSHRCNRKSPRSCPVQARIHAFSPVDTFFLRAGYISAAERAQWRVFINRAYRFTRDLESCTRTAGPEFPLRVITSVCSHGG